MATETTGHFSCTDWQENAVGAREQGPSLARASAVNAFTGGIEAGATSCEYTVAYAEDKSGTFAGFELFDGRLDGRGGAFLVEERGRFDAEGTVHCTFEVVPGTATGELAGLRGSGSFTARAGEKSIAYTFAYELG
ncbi:DUF3224 domain-containing protein [Kitasatospora sp. NPDC054939]